MADDKARRSADGPPERRGTPAEFGMSWLLGIAHDALDPGYAEAARRARSGTPRRTIVLRVTAAMLVAGIAVGIAVGWRQLTAPADARARTAVLQDVRVAQSRQAALESRAEQLDVQIRDRQVLAGAGGPLRSVAGLRADAALSPVTGPGLQLTVDQADSTTPILDRDLQFLVNGLWEAGAEAISVGGVRLRATSAIRQAGGAILVDNRPVLWPIVLEAIGDPDALQVQLVATAGYGRMASLRTNYGAEFSIASSDALTLAGAGSIDLRYAAVPSASSGTGTTSIPTTEPTR